MYLCEGRILCTRVKHQLHQNTSQRLWVAQYAHRMPFAFRTGVPLGQEHARSVDVSNVSMKVTREGGGGQGSAVKRRMGSGRAGTLALALQACQAWGPGWGVL